MDPGAFFLIWGLFMLFSKGKKRRRRRGDSWRRSAEALGLSWSRRRPYLIRGTIDGCEVAVEKVDGETKSTRYRVSHPRLPKDLFLRAESTSSKLFRAVGFRQQVETGDRTFDQQIEVSGPEAVALAALGAEAREATMRVLKDGATHVRNGQVVRTLEGVVKSQSEIDRNLRTLVTLTSHLRLERGVPAALARNAARDRRTGVRVRNLLMLQREFPAATETRQASRSALDDQDPRLRLQGSLTLGKEAIPCLLQLLGEKPPAEVEARALDRLLQLLEPTKRDTLIADRLAHAEGPALEVALRAAGQLRLEATVPRLLALAGSTQENADVSLALADTLTKIGGDRVETGLLKILAEHPHHQARIAAAEGLARWGTVGAIPTLRSQTARVLENQLNRSARQAIEEIKNRVKEATPGALAIAETDRRGGLQLAGQQEGELALAGGADKLRS